MKYSLFIEADGALAEQLSFLARAVSDDETRYFMNFIFVEPSEAPDDRKDKTLPLLRAVSIDGRRLHLVDPLSDSAAVAGMPPGFYRVLKTGRRVWLACLSEAPGTFPNYRKVIPSDTPKFETTFDSFSLGRAGIARHSPDIIKFFRSFPEATAINLQYLADLGSDMSWKVKWADSRRAVSFECGPRLAVIMPMQAD